MVSVHPEALAAVLVAVVAVVVVHVGRLMHRVASAGVAGIGTLATPRAKEK
jgi:hypothetical protein